MGIRKKFFNDAVALLARIEELLPTHSLAPAWESHLAFRWVREGYVMGFQPIRRISGIRLDNLKCIDRQATALAQNTRQLLGGLPCNHALLWGPRGTGKSSLVLAILNEYQQRGLKLIQIDRHLLIDLPRIIDIIESRPEKFILFCDDLSFAEADDSYKDLKVLLDGSGQRLAENTILYATSNRRHLLPEHMSENRQAWIQDGELHYGDSTEEKLSLSERFGLRLSFQPFDQEQYLSVVYYWLGQLLGDQPDQESVRNEALKWALQHGSRSGRSAWQFARAWAGARLLQEDQAP